MNLSSSIINRHILKELLLSTILVVFLLTLLLVFANLLRYEESFLHILDKERLVEDLYRVLKPGGFLCVGDWMRIDDNAPSKLMQEYIKLEGLSMNMCSLQRYGNALNNAGFKNIKLTDRNKLIRIISSDIDGTLIENNTSQYFINTKYNLIFDELWFLLRL